MSNANDFTVENGVLTKYTGPGGVVIIPAGITAIGNTAFLDCTNLTGVTIPAGVTYIGVDTFAGCPKLTIRDPADSYAETYSRENNIPFTAL